MTVGKLFYIWLPTLCCALALKTADNRKRPNSDDYDGPSKRRAYDLTDGVLGTSAKGHYVASGINDQECVITGPNFKWHFRTGDAFVHTITLECIDDEHYHNHFAFNGHHIFEGGFATRSLSGRTLGRADPLSHADLAGMIPLYDDGCWGAVEKVNDYTSVSTYVELDEDNVADFFVRLCSKYRQAIFRV
ncbi:hypothetical protein FOZ61_006511 [Perkinsus olseni]|uniref:Uncharacterized protein n=1 Tax=Perkinsus olseni TaxID=32597 RepID=A0A7J6LCS9_PEROL|nr:hypothetical protein FOZ61_006511 [Perkinsus olseni]KAF4661154.1 hypothetical protein FOL46_005848 [Perkinsus olseni]